MISGGRLSPFIQVSGLCSEAINLRNAGSRCPTKGVADARSDQFSFCVTLYEAFFGHPPFGGDSIDAIGPQVLQGRVRKPDVDPSFPRPLLAAILRGLALEPDARHETMRPLIEILDAMAERPAEASASSPC